MAIFKVEKSVILDHQDSPIRISVNHRSLVGTESYHLIDIPDNDNYYDYEWPNEGSVIIGKASKFKGKQIIIYSKAININKRLKDISLDYLINGTICYSHTNKKEDDDTPSIILKINFSE